MKKIAVLALTISILASCKSKSGSESTQTDSVAVTQADSTAPSSDALYLDDVLACNDYEGLVKKFGAENIIKKQLSRLAKVLLTQPRFLQELPKKSKYIGKMEKNTKLLVMY
jgi:hypothetical protein